MYLIDTDWVVDYLKVRPDTRSLIARLVPDGIAISSITYGEVYEGIAFGRDVTLHEQGFRGFLRVAEVLPLNRRMMRRFADVRGDLRQRGLIIGDMDILIAATALDHGLTLLTRNTRHVARIPGLTLYESSTDS